MSGLQDGSVLPGAAGKLSPSNQRVTDRVQLLGPVSPATSAALGGALNDLVNQQLGGGQIGPAGVGGTDGTSGTDGQSGQSAALDATQLALLNTRGLDLAPVVAVAGMLLTVSYGGQLVTATNATGVPINVGDVVAFGYQIGSTSQVVAVSPLFRNVAAGWAELPGGGDCYCLDTVGVTSGGVGAWAAYNGSSARVAPAVQGAPVMAVSPFTVSPKGVGFGTGARVYDLAGELTSLYLTMRSGDAAPTISVYRMDSSGNGTQTTATLASDPGVRCAMTAFQTTEGLDLDAVANNRLWVLDPTGDTTFRLWSGSSNVDGTIGFTPYHLSLTSGSFGYQGYAVSGQLVAAGNNRLWVRTANSDLVCVDTGVLSEGMSLAPVATAVPQQWCCTPLGDLVGAAMSAQHTLALSWYGINGPYAARDTGFALTPTSVACDSYGNIYVAGSAPASALYQGIVDSASVLPAIVKVSPTGGLTVVWTSTDTQTLGAAVHQVTINRTLGTLHWLVPTSAKAYDQYTDMRAYWAPLPTS